MVLDEVEVEVVSTGPSKAWSVAPGVDVASLLLGEHVPVQLVPQATLVLRPGNAELSSY